MFCHRLYERNSLQPDIRWNLRAGFRRTKFHSHGRWNRRWSGNLHNHRGLPLPWKNHLRWPPGRTHYRWHRGQYERDCKQLPKRRSHYRESVAKGKRGSRRHRGSVQRERYPHHQLHQPSHPVGHQRILPKRRHWTSRHSGHQFFRLHHQRLPERRRGKHTVQFVTNDIQPVLGCRHYHQ